MEFFRPKEESKEAKAEWNSGEVLFEEGEKLGEAISKKNGTRRAKTAALALMMLSNAACVSLEYSGTGIGSGGVRLGGSGAELGGNTISLEYKQPSYSPPQMGQVTEIKKGKHGNRTIVYETNHKGKKTGRVISDSYDPVTIKIK